MQSIAYIPASNGVANPSLMTVQTVRSPGATSIITNTVAGAPTFFCGTMGAPHTFTDPVTSEVITIISESTAVDFFGQIVSGHVEIISLAPGYVDTRGSLVGDIIVIRPISGWADNIYNILSQAHQDNGALKTTSLDAFYKPGEISGSFVFSGGVIALTTGLTASFSDIIFYTSGLRYTKTAVANRIYTVSKDTYVDIDATGTLYYTEVANGASTGFALTAGRVRLAKVVTSGSTITSVLQTGNDALGYMIYARQPGTSWTDANGWKVYQYADHREYTYRYSFNLVNLVGNGSVNYMPGVNLPVGIATIASTGNIRESHIINGASLEVVGVHISNISSATSISGWFHNGSGTTLTYTGWTDLTLVV